MLFGKSTFFLTRMLLTMVKCKSPSKIEKQKKNSDGHDLVSLIYLVQLMMRQYPSRPLLIQRQQGKLQNYV